MGDALEEMKDEIKLSQNNVSHAGEFRRNLGQPELDLLSDESVFPCLRTSISPFFFGICTLGGRRFVYTQDLLNSSCDTERGTAVMRNARVSASTW
jgi:hypothetical protein